MTVPQEILQAVSAPGGGRVTLIVGAGCSFEAPTLIPLASTCSQECHARLVADGVLSAGDCSDPSNLSCLADAVYSKTGGQRRLVEQLIQHYDLKTASPNLGHRLAAALLREGAIASVATLNFDLALSNAVSLLGVGDSVGVVDGPGHLADLKAHNVYYLHRNANSDDPETWVLRTETLESQWEGQWEQVIANMVLATPVVVFVGLGSPAEVLVESATLVREAIPGGHSAFLVDPGDPNESTFFKALALPPGAFVPATWCDFMEALAQRVLVEHTRALRAAAEAVAGREALVSEDLSGLLDRIRNLGLLGAGSLRGRWLLREKEYCAEDELAREPLADLLLAAALIARVTGSVATLFDDGVVEFRRGAQTVSAYLFATGLGTHSEVSLEAKLQARRRQLRNRALPVSGAIIAGARNVGSIPPTPPPDVLLGDTSESIVVGATRLQMFHVDTLRHETERCQKVVP